MSRFSQEKISSFRRNIFFSQKKIIFSQKNIFVLLPESKAPPPSRLAQQLLRPRRWFSCRLKSKISILASKYIICKQLDHCFLLFLFEAFISTMYLQDPHHHNPNEHHHHHHHHNERHHQRCNSASSIRSSGPAAAVRRVNKFHPSFTSTYSSWLLSLYHDYDKQQF